MHFLYNNCFHALIQLRLSLVPKSSGNLQLNISGNLQHIWILSLACGCGLPAVESHRNRSMPQCACRSSLDRLA